MANALSHKERPGAAPGGARGLQFRARAGTPRDLACETGPALNGATALRERSLAGQGRCRLTDATLDGSLSYGDRKRGHSE